MTSQKMEDWLDIINEENNKNNDNDNDDNIEQPPSPKIIDLNDDGTLQKEISYKLDDDDSDKVIRIERIFQTVTREQQLSTAAIHRKRNWRKFGQVKDVPLGQLERGVTTQRNDGLIQFTWKDSKPRKAQKRKPKMNTFKPPKPDDIKQPENDINGKAAGKYIPPWQRATGSDASWKEEKIDIKISNLPQWTTRNDVKQLIDAFYKKHLKQSYIPRYRISMYPSDSRLEQWKADPVYYKRKLEEYDRMAFVEFDSRQKAELAVKILNGHRYEYNILYAQIARPRNS